MRIKHIIGGLLIAAGMLTAFGTIGHFDYLDEIGEPYSFADIDRAAIKCGISLGGAFAGILLCRDLEAEDEDEPDKPEEKENRTDR